MAEEIISNKDKDFLNEIKKVRGNAYCMRNTVGPVSGNEKMGNYLLILMSSYTTVFHTIVMICQIILHYFDNEIFSR